MKTHTRTTQTATDPAIDLFQHLGRAGLTDPYGCYRQLREHDPVHRTRHGLWVLTRHADVAAVLRDPRFGREGFERHFGMGGGSSGTSAGDGLADAARRTGSGCSRGMPTWLRSSATRGSGARASSGTSGRAWDLSLIHI